MKMNFTLIRVYLMLLSGLLLSTVTTARPVTYCTPTFANGCLSWNIQQVTLETINWYLGSDCTEYDFTSESATLNTGTTYAMSVTSGNWCGCSVWIDLNQDENFEDSENFFHSYDGAQTHSYSINLTIPNTVPTGSYRMRIVAGWGSDGFSVGGNGYGPCGSYQYGNFTDFTVNVIQIPAGITGPDANGEPFIIASPNPASASVVVTMRRFKGSNANLQLTDINGHLVRHIGVTKEKEELDLSSLANGVYILRYVDGFYDKKIRLIK